MKVFVCMERDSAPSAVFSRLSEARRFQASHQHDDIFEVEVNRWPLEGKNKYGAEWSKYPHVQEVSESR